MKKKKKNKRNLLTCFDDVINLKEIDDGFGGELDGAVEDEDRGDDVALEHVGDLALGVGGLAHVDAGVALAGGVGGLELGDDLDGVEAGVLGEGVRDDLEGLGVLARAELLDAGEGLGPLADAEGDLGLGRAAAGAERADRDEAADDAERVGEAALGRVDDGRGRAAPEDADGVPGVGAPP